MKKLIGLALAFILIGGCTSAPDAKTGETLAISKMGGGKPYRFTVEIADDDAERAMGLMKRKALPHDEGMLFVFAKVDKAAFWMKDTLIPLDMIFINPDGSIRSIHENAVPLSLKTVKSGGPVKAGLEINGGLARKMGLKPGDIVHHKIFGNALAHP